MDNCLLQQRDDCVEPRASLMRAKKKTTMTMSRMAVEDVGICWNLLSIHPRSTWNSINDALRGSHSTSQMNSNDIFIFGKGLWLVFTSTIGTERVKEFPMMQLSIGHCPSNRRDMASSWTLQSPLRVPKESTQLPSCIGKSNERYVASGRFFSRTKGPVFSYEFMTYTIVYMLLACVSSLSKIDLVTFYHINVVSRHFRRCNFLPKK